MHQSSHLSDLVYLDCFRLLYESTSIGNYLRWFMTSSLNARVTGELTKSLWHKAQSLRLSSVVDESGRLDNRALIKTFDGPSDAIAHAYGDILFDDTRGTDDRAFPSQVPMHDLVEGDLFVRPKGRDRKGYDTAEVRMVMTPSCDLISRTPNRNPSVLLLPGILKKMEREDTKINFARVYSVRVLERGEMSLLWIEWDFDHPISVDWPTMSKKGPGKGFKRLGRVRDLYFHKVRDDFANHFTRIGPEVAPLFPHPRSGKVLVRVTKGKRKFFKTVMCFSSEDRFVWEIGPVSVTQPARSSEYVYQASRQFVCTLIQTLHEAQDTMPDLEDAAKHVMDHLKNMRTYIDLLRPMLPGTRGERGVVEFKKMKRSDPKLNSNADLLIVTFVD